MFLLKIHLRCTLYSITVVTMVNTSRLAAPCSEAVPTAGKAQYCLIRRDGSNESFPA